MGREINNSQAPTSEQVIEKVCKDKNDLLKLSLNDSLKKGINIINETQYKRWVKLLKENNIIDLSNTSFSDISKDGLSFAIKRINDDAYVTIFSTYSLLGMNPNGPFSKGGVVHNGGKFEKFLDTKINHQTNSDGIDLPGITENETESCDTNTGKEKKGTQKKSIRTPAVYSKEPAKWERSEPKQNNNAKEFLLPTLDTIYTIQKGDTLWKIVKEKYGITDNLELANFINKLVKYNEAQKRLNKLDNVPEGGDGIKGDTIIIGKTIYLPDELKFRKIIKKRIN